MKPFNVVDMQIARNPVARAIANKALDDAVKLFQIRLYLLADGEHCESDAVAATQVLAVVSEALSLAGRGKTPEHQVIRGALSCLVQLANRGFAWKAMDAGAIDAALSRAVDLYKSMKAQTINMAWANVMATSRCLAAEKDAA